MGRERAPREVCSFGAGQQEILSPQLAAATDTKQSATCNSILPNPISGGAKTISTPLALGSAAVAGRLRWGSRWGYRHFSRKRLKLSPKTPPFNHIDAS